MRIYGKILKRMMMMMMIMKMIQLSMIRECGLVTVHLITTMKQNRLLMILLMHLLLKSKFMNRSTSRTDWSVPGVGDFSIESMPKIIPSTDEHELYKGAMFKNKDELKTSLGKYALK